MEASESRTEEPPPPPAGETPAPAPTGAEGTRFQNHVPSGTYFGLNRSHLNSWGIGSTPRDYEARYPPDPRGQEMSENARIWPIYNEEAADFDANMLAEWRDTIDVLLVFAGLFSAIVTTFVVQTSQNMQPDYNEASTLLLFEILKATASNDSQLSIPSSPTDFFSPSRSDEWTNSLWFMSLTLSLVTALVAVLVKQWLHQYTAIISDSSTRDRARIRHLRYAGLQTWQVPMIIGLLPVLLHVSLALFFAGLSIFLFSLGMKVAWLVSMIGAATYMAYVIALILPLIHPFCPYKVPLTLYFHRPCQYVHRLFQYTLHLCRYGNSYLIPRIRYYIRIVQHNLHGQNYWRRQERWEREGMQKSLFSFPKSFPTLKEIEYDYVQQNATMTDVQSLTWLHSSTSNVSVHQSILQAISGMTLDTVKCLSDKNVTIFLASLYQLVQPVTLFVPSLGRLDLYCRAYSLLCGPLVYGEFNEQLTMVLYSTSAEKVSAAFLEILHSPHRSSLMLHPAVWKTLLDTTISSPALSHSALALELEFMKILADSTTTSEGEDSTTINNLTDEMRVYMCNKLLACWGYDRTQCPSNISIGIMFSLMPRIHQRLLNPSHAFDQKEVMETALAIIKGIFSVLQDIIPYSMIGRISDSFTGLFSLLSSEFETSGVDAKVDIFACGISMAFITAQSQWIESFPIGWSWDEKEKIIEMGVDRLIDIMLLLIDRHHQHILYAWVEDHWHLRTYLRTYISDRCVGGLIQWASGEEFHRWTFLKRVLAIVVIGELQRKRGYTDDDKPLPQYDYWVHTEVEQLPWLFDIYSPSLSSNGEPNPLEYSKIIEHPKFQEFLEFGHLSQGDVHVEDWGKYIDILHSYRS